jgi:integrase
MTPRQAIEIALDDLTQNGAATAQLDRRRAERHLHRLLEGLDETTEGVTMLQLMRYAQARGAEGASNATINRELAVLRKGCLLAEIRWPAKWKQRKESAPRSGFTSREDVERVCSVLPAGYADAARFCLLTGWRRTEALNLRWSEVDFERGEVKLLAGTTKNREPRVFPLYPQLRELLQKRLVVGALDDTRVFGYSNGSAFSRTWKRACVKAGVKPVLLHDFRRPAARNMIEAGIDRQVAMKLLGHKTESIFNRYRITTGKELENAAAKLSNLLG